MSERQAVESPSTPRMDAKPVELPCQGPACSEYVITYLTDGDIEAHETVQVLRYTPETDDERVVRYFFARRVAVLISSTQSKVVNEKKRSMTSRAWIVGRKAMSEMLASG